MLPEHRLLNEEFNTFNRIVVKKTCVIIVTKVVWIRQRIVTQFSGFPKFDTHHIGHIIQPFQYSVGQSDVADGCYCRLPEKFVDSSSTHVMFDSPVH